VILPEGRRRRDFQASATMLFTADFEGRVLSFDASAAAVYAEIFAARRRAGRSTPTLELVVLRSAAFR
jgi:predicted nucleic acid-binding protein